MKAEGADWTQVVRDPLGLAGYALFLVFSIIGAARFRGRPKWVVPAAFAFAAVALIGGLTLAYKREISREGSKDSGKTSGGEKIAIGSISQSGEQNIAGVINSTVNSNVNATGQNQGAFSEPELKKLWIDDKISDADLVSLIRRRHVSFSLSGEFQDFAHGSKRSSRVTEAVINNYTPPK